MLPKWRGINANRWPIEACQKIYRRRDLGGAAADIPHALYGPRGLERMSMHALLPEHELVQMSAMSLRAKGKVSRAIRGGSGLYAHKVFPKDCAVRVSVIGRELASQMGTTSLRPEAHASGMLASG